ncbi:olfactory receptor 8B3-like, partial [Octodon degus]|uniref:Olfactory receptor n=1 Tax=Octodon degus TaxID=10160 RepID=A0A6P6EY00_OCTDE
MRELSRNESLVTEFVLAGLTDCPEFQLPLFCMFLMIYIVTLVGNLGLVTLIALNSHLHTPMYYFLFNLSYIDLCYSSVFTPKMLMNFISKKNGISYAGCMIQLCFFLFFVISECYMLTAMAYDRYVAICNPLLYKITMSQPVCSGLSLAAYAMGFAGASAHTGCMLRLTFCSANVINHYLCDILPLLQLSCTSTYVNEVVVLIVVGINITVPSVTILISYIFISTSILGKSVQRVRPHCLSRKKTPDCTWSTLSTLMPIVPQESGVLNPLIYSLRNKDVKVALKNVMIKIQSRD